MWSGRRVQNAGWALTVGAVAFAAGCGSQDAPVTAKLAGPSAEGQKFLLSAAPENARQVIAARSEAGADEEVVVVGRIGGSTQPFVDGMAAFSIVDNSLKACSDIPGDKCPTPWDYCCEADLPKSRTLVKLVDESGKVVTTDARKLLGVSELQTVYVQGKAQRDADGNLSVLASRIYVQPGGTAPVVTGEAHEHAHDHDHADPPATGEPAAPSAATEPAPAQP